MPNLDSDPVQPTVPDTSAQFGVAPSSDVTTFNSNDHGYISNPFVIFWAGFKGLSRNIKPLLLVVVSTIGLLLLFIPGGIAFFIGAKNGNSVADILGLVLILVAFVVAIIIGIRLSAAAYLIYLANARGETKSFGEFYNAAKPVAAKLFILNLVLAIIIGLGFVILLIPGLLFTYWFSLAPYIMVNEECGVREAMSRSRQLVRGHGWEMFGLYGVIQLFSVLSVIPILGFIVSVLSSFAAQGAYAIRYLQLRDLPEGVVPPKNGLNYVMAVFAPIALIGITSISIVNGIHNIDNNKSLNSPSVNITAP